MTRSKCKIWNIDASGPRGSLLASSARTRGSRLSWRSAEGKRGAPVEDVSGVIYLAGEGSMSFVYAVVSQTDVKPGDLEREF